MREICLCLPRAHSLDSCAKEQCKKKNCRVIVGWGVKVSGSPSAENAKEEEELSLLDSLEGTEGVLAGVGDVKESVLILMLLVNRTHERGGWWQDLIDEDEDGLLGRQLDALADDIDELAYGEIGWHQILLLIDRCDVRLLDLLANDGDAIAVFLTDTFGLSLALLEGVFVLKLGSHLEGCNGVVSW